ncbi:hypothetical protein QBZ16_003856 [Prototheca wickerhamii]|uniref:Succinate dehydrogenase assembly factor 3 n=1 Tax=Prototheca wickerhamii TaxID=3111 RepID=A0AAD9MLE2_PROWI|nr:hypothetical protein QBZ16_003856 [Prototheca wickerhamii]
MASSPAEAARPILRLFRAILRLHQEKLPPPMRDLGTTFVRDEFRKHLRGKTTEEQWKQFVGEWQGYLRMLHSSESIADSGGVAPADASGDMPPEIVEKLSPDQLERLGRLQREAFRLRDVLLSQDGGGDKKK